MKKHYYLDGLYDFYLFDFEEEARNFDELYRNIYYSYGWKCWVASRTVI